MASLPCTDCHMPPLVRSATGNAATFTGDLASHQFAINPDPQAAQFSADGTATPWITLDYACRWCHGPAGVGLDKTDEELEQSARGYHAP